MDIDRAIQIFDSPNKVNINFEGEPVWIEEIYESSQTARVHLEKKPSESMQVKVAELHEQ